MSPILTVLKKVYKMSDTDRYAAFGEANVGRIIEKVESDAEFLYKYYEWEDNNTITVGDEVRVHFNKSEVFVWVTYINNDDITLDGVTSEGETRCFIAKDCEKTGRHSETLVKLFNELRSMDK